MGMTLEEYESSDLMAENEFLRKQLAEALKHRRMFEADYENRIKADMAAMLTEIQLEIEENGIVDFEETYVDDGECIISVSECNRLIQQKINELKAESEDTCELI